MAVCSSSKKALPGTEVGRWSVGQLVGPQYYTDLIYSFSLRWEHSVRGAKKQVLSLVKKSYDNSRLLRDGSRCLFHCYFAAEYPDINLYFLSTVC